jgi:hypothetical protein
MPEIYRAGLYICDLCNVKLSKLYKDRHLNSDHHTLNLFKQEITFGEDFKEDIEATIYIIKNTENNKVYIGQTIHTIQQRFRTHIRELIKKIHRDKKFQDLYNEIGREKFYVEELEKITCKIINDVKAREKHYIEKYDSIKNGLNIMLPTETQSENEYWKKNKDKKAAKNERYRNKPEKKKWSNLKIKCLCAGSYSMFKGRSAHFQYNNHKEWLKTINDTKKSDELIIENEEKHKKELRKKINGKDEEEDEEEDE